MVVVERHVVADAFGGRALARHSIVDEVEGGLDGFAFVLRCPIKAGPGGQPAIAGAAAFDDFQHAVAGPRAGRGRRRVGRGAGSRLRAGNLHRNGPAGSVIAGGGGAPALVQRAGIAGEAVDEQRFAPRAVHRLPGAQGGPRVGESLVEFPQARLPRFHFTGQSGDHIPVVRLDPILNREGGIEDRLEPVVIALRERFELVVVALRALKCQAEQRAGDNLLA